MAQGLSGGCSRRRATRSRRSSTQTLTNIPTSELADFASDTKNHQHADPRDPSLDPQLVWQGKDEQDAMTPVVPIIRKTAGDHRGLRRDSSLREPEMSLFGDFDGIEPGMSSTSITTELGHHA